MPSTDFNGAPILILSLDDVLELRDLTPLIQESTAKKIDDFLNHPHCQEWIRDNYEND